MSDLTSRTLTPTPLHARTAELCAANSWTAQGGFTIPAAYSSEREELETLTTRVGLSDLSARRCWTFEGPDAAAFLSFATVVDVTVLEPGQTTRTVWCDDDGHVRGEGTIVRFGESQFELSAHVGDFAWLQDGVRGFDVKIVDVTGQRAGVGVRGPLAAALLAVAGFAATPQKGGDMMQPTWRQAQVALLRDASGDGFELWTQAEDGIVVWDRLFRSGASLGGAPVGAAALETIRVENAQPWCAVDWLPAQLALNDSDLRVPQDLGFSPNLSRRFNGSAALGRGAFSGRAFQFVQLTAPQQILKGPLNSKDTVVGAVTSQVWSSNRERSFAIAWLRSDLAKLGGQISGVGIGGQVNTDVARICFL